MSGAAGYMLVAGGWLVEGTILDREAVNSSREWDMVDQSHVHSHTHIFIHDD